MRSDLVVFWVPNLEIIPLLGRPLRFFNLSYLIDGFNYWWCDYAFECYLRTHRRPSMAHGHIVDIFSIPPASYPVHYVMAPSWWRAFEGHRLLFVMTPRVVLYHFHYIFHDYSELQILLGIAMLEFLVCTFTASQCLAHEGSVFS